jgi:hypothetical protein
MKETPTASPAASVRRVVLRVGIALVAFAAVISGAAAPGGAASPRLTITKTAFPNTNGVTRGYNVLYTLTVTNGSTAANHVTVTDPAPGAANAFPAGTTILTATTTKGTCTIAVGATSVTCDLGQMEARQAATIKIKVKTTTNTAVNSFTNKAMASLNEGGNDQEAPAQHVDTFSAAVTTSLIAAGDPRFAQGYFDTGCDPSNPNDPSLLGTNQDVTATDVQSTLVCAPVAGGTVITVGETPDTNNTAPGFSETSTICIPQPGGAPCSVPALLATPATFKFKLHPEVLPTNFKVDEMIVYHDGTPVTAFCNSDGSLPSGVQICKFPATQESSKPKIVTQVVKSLVNGAWQFGP